MCSNVSLVDTLSEMYRARRWAKQDGDLARVAKLDALINERELDERMARAAIPPRAIAYTLDSSPAAPVLVNRCREWLDAPDQGIYLHGPTGVGKSGLAVGLLVASLQHGRTGRFVSVPEALTCLREAASGDESANNFRRRLRDDIERAEVVVLDDLGVGQWTAWIEETVYGWIATRYESFMTTVVTSNLSPAQLPAAIGDRAAWRVIEMSGDYIIKATGPNQRARHATGARRESE